ncbi:unnamed protein product, partial [Chrysoparadoxa australica]
RRAFGSDGLGIILVSGIEGLNEKRNALLPLAKKFANLPDEVKEKYQDIASGYQFGWSHGKEILAGGLPDYNKGSYYNNPLIDDPGGREGKDDRHPSFTTPNIWPKEMPELQEGFMGLGSLMVEVGKLVAEACDTLVVKEGRIGELGKLRRMVESSKSCKGRLLHYFPSKVLGLKGGEGGRVSPDGDGDFSGWCSWHNDRGTLTALVSAMYLDAESKEVNACDVDPSVGLYIKSRAGVITQASILTLATPAPACQIGEAAQIHSGGVLRATAHAVKCARKESMSRETFAVFMQPTQDEPLVLPQGVAIDEVASTQLNNTSFI